MLLQAVDEAKGAVLIGATERTGHAWVGQDLGEAMGGKDYAAVAVGLRVFAGELEKDRRLKKIHRTVVRNLNIHGLLPKP